MARKHVSNLLIKLDPDAGEPLYEQLYRELRRLIIQGDLAEGDRLPSIREVSHELRVSHITVERSYLQLCVEGYVQSLPRSGYVVCRIDTDFFKAPFFTKVVPAGDGNEHASDGNEYRARMPERLPFDPLRHQSALGQTVRYDFSFTRLQQGSFPAQTWHQLTDDVLFSRANAGFERYQDIDEASPFSRALAAYLQRARGVSCAPEQVVACPGTEAALTKILHLFDRDSCLIGVEEPGYGTIRRAAQRLGYPIAPLPVDQGWESVLAAVEREKPKILFLMPSHQFPTGSVLPLGGRVALLEWAQANNAFIIEDDSCNEYRYETSPIPSLQSLDPYGRVIYLGNFSKVLSPSMRVAYVVLSPRLMRRYGEQYGHSFDDMSWLTLEVLARFIDQGFWEQQVHRMVTATRKRHDALLRGLRETMGDHLDIGGIDSGIHFYVTVRNGMDQDELMAHALEHDANVYSTDRYWFTRPPVKGCVMVGFSGIALDDIEPGVAALRSAWFA